jgi:hypothetical protein
MYKTKLGVRQLRAGKKLSDVFVYSKYLPTKLMYKNKLLKNGQYKPVPALKEVYLRCQHGYFHDIIWELHNGPKAEGLWIDHIDGNKWNNDISNLRLVEPSVNRCNWVKDAVSFIPEL